LAGFGDEISHRLLNLRAHGEVGFTVGNHVDFVVDGLAGRGEVDGAVVFAGDYGRIDEQVERDGLEGDAISALGGYGESGAELPAVGHDKRGFVVELVRGRACGIEDGFIPLEDHELVGGGDAVRLDVVVLGVEVGCAGWDVDVEGEDVQQIALPGDGLSV